MLDLRKRADPMAPIEAPIAQAQSRKKVLSVKRVESSGHRLCYSRKGLLRILTWSTEMASNTNFRSKKEGILLVTKALLNLGNGLESLGRRLGKVVEPLIALVGSQGVKPRKLLGSGRAHLWLHE